LEDELMALRDCSCEWCWKDRSATNVAGETFSVRVEKVSFVFVRAGVLGMSTVISGRGGRAVFGSRPAALLDCEDAMFNRQGYMDVIKV
jgi:hypothetical protein